MSSGGVPGKTMLLQEILGLRPTREIPGRLSQLVKPFNFENWSTGCNTPKTRVRFDYCVEVALALATAINTKKYTKYKFEFRGVRTREVHRYVNYV
jgi:hypothetical protein